jgi:DNA-binding HxlR family transcriptional regulator
LTITKVKQKGEIDTRAGINALLLLSAPINVAVLQALADGPKALIYLRRAAGSPPQTTMRGHLRALIELEILEKHRRNDFPGPVDVQLTLRGSSLLFVAEIVRGWLATAPDGPIALGSSDAKSAIKALIEGWNSNMVRALAARPLSLTELDRVIGNFNYPSIERRLAAMRLAGQVRAMLGRGRSTPYEVTNWLRRSIGPLGAAIQWERSYLRADATPVSNRDAEATFLLGIPLLDLPADFSGRCRLAVEMRSQAGSALTGVMVTVVEGKVASCISRLGGEADAWASGGVTDWLHAVIQGDVAHLELGGDGSLATAVVDGLHGVLSAPVLPKGAPRSSLSSL